MEVSAEQELARLRAALNGYHDSDLASLATTMRVRLDYLEERYGEDNRVFVWQGPRLVDGSMWMDLEWTEGVSEVTGEPIMVRYARVSWRHGSEAPYSVSITYQREQGLGLYQWPKFHNLRTAQRFAEMLMRLEPHEAQLIHGAHWNGVVL